MTEDEMVGWHHQLYGHEFEQALGDGERQGSLACCSPQGQKELDTTERLKTTGLVALRYVGLPRPGIELVSPTLTGGFLTTGLPETSSA